MNYPHQQTSPGMSTAEQQLASRAVHTANAGAALARVEQLHQQLATEIAALREHLSKAAGG